MGDYVKIGENSAELKESLEEWFEEYNRDYLHSALGYRTPERFREAVSKHLLKTVYEQIRGEEKAEK